MCRCLMGISLVSQHGPNPQSRTPDRSVSLPDPRETAAEMMGGIGNVSNLTLKRLQKRHTSLIDRYEGLAPDAPGAPYNQERDDLLDQIAEVEEQIRKMEPPPPPPPVEVLDLTDPAARKAALAQWGAPHLEPLPDLPPDVHTMASGEPGRIGRSNPEGPVPDYVSPEPMSDEERQTGKEWIEKIRTDNEEVLNPDSSMMSSIWNAVMGAVPDIDPKTAIMVASAVAAAIAVGTGVGGPLAPVILGGGAALASQ